jgi:hypothetical protein
MVLQFDTAKCLACGGQFGPDIAEKGMRKMRKSVLSLIIVSALAGWAGTAVAAADTQHPPFGANCTARSAKDVALNRTPDRCAPSHN